ncbi:alpha/beta fold hydrolase [Williamsia sterculiae]|uniref:Lysophospholipase, alpha-beta hydrolase superfamily n=1 Tax=Williamsia sterculiae TaxID=1344003 RepID=A0A1N7H3Z2_9NOCA|nr:alpha/beta hydrolase [Williamsia sterculiae]SIS19408.1 Lysophospholipase, alpha-beta hydrolase superfamily [Williamsia sterculiae]
MPSDTFEFTDSTGTTLAAYRWDPSAAARAAVQIVHGMGEHVLRYEHVAAALNDAGFVVYGYDQRAHGASTGSAELGAVGGDGWRHLVDDISEFARFIRQNHPGLRNGLFAHSMGSFAAQQALLDHSADFDAVALSGTASIDILEPVLDLSGPLDLAMFNAPFQPPRTDFDWLSRDEAQVDAYVDDPLTGFGIDPDGAREMFVGARALADPERVAGIRHDLPIYLAVGESDPVNGALALFNPLVERLRSAGVEDLTTRVYPEARHEIVNELNRDEVIGELITWFGERLIVD